MWYCNSKIESQNITGNLPIDLVCEIVSFSYKFQHQLKFQPVLQDIEDSTMCVLQTLIYHLFRRAVYPLYVDSYMFNLWESRMHPKYEDFEQYEGSSRYLTCHDVIQGSKQLRKQCKRCKYPTINEIAALVERNHIMSAA